MSLVSRNRILHVLHAYRPGGMENMIAQMACRLPDHEFHVGICSLTTSNGFRSRLPERTQLFELNKPPGVDLKTVYKLRKLIKQFQPTVVHSHNWDGLLYSCAALTGLNLSLLHGEHAQFYTWERTSWRQLVRRILYSRCDVVHTVSKGQADELISLGLLSTKNLKVIQNGVDTDRFSPQDRLVARKEFRLPNEAFILGMVARCIEDKRHHLLLAAFEDLAPTMPNLWLAFAGSGGNIEGRILEIIRGHKYKDRIVWLGHQDNMPAIYNSFDLLVLPSTTEGMSNVCLEAMACGLPILVHDACGVDELINDNHNGFIKKMHHSEDLSKAISSLISFPEILRETGRNARITSLKSYQLKRVQEDYADVYRQLAGSVIN